MYNAGGAASPAPLITQTPLLLSSSSLSWYFSQGVSPFHDWRNISGQSGLFCFKTTAHLHNLRMSSSLFIAAREGQTPRLPQEVIPPPTPPPPPPPPPSSQLIPPSVQPHLIPPARLQAWTLPPQGQSVRDSDVSRLTGSQCDSTGHQYDPLMGQHSVTVNKQLKY